MGKLKRKGMVGRVLAGLFLLCAGMAFGWVISNHSGKNKTYALLDPSVSNNNVQQDLIKFDPLRQDLKKYLSSLGLYYSFYFEYLPNGVNIRSGEDQVSVAASLMKTPVVMDLYKLAEEGKLNLDDTVMIQESDISNDADYGDPTGLVAGTTISLRNAAQHALHDSDNTSISIIKRIVTPLATNDSDAIQSLDIPYTFTGDNKADKVLSISARSYSSILKCLYYSCFLEPKDSQEILSYLIGSRGINRLSAGVVPTVKVAHKIGSGVQAQSDCGIFYKPKQPYLICLMFWDYKNTGGDETSAYFKEVSKKIDSYISKNGD